MIKIAVCDDEAECRADVSAAIQSCEDVFSAAGETVGLTEFQSGARLAEACEHDGDRFQIIFIDMDFGEKAPDGIEICRRLRKIDKDVFIIIVSRHDSYMPDGYIVHAFRYLDKPIVRERFREALTGVMRELSENDKTLIFADCDRVKAVLRCSDLLYVEYSADHTCALYTCGGAVHNTYTNLSDIEAELPKSCFFRINRGTVVNFAHVGTIRDKDVILTDGRRLPISRRRFTECLQFFSDYAREHT